MSTETKTRHTCNEGEGPSFGRLAPRGECKRCDELRFGMLPRKGWTPRSKLGWCY